MSRLRWKLLAAMIALVLVTVGLSGVFTRRVAHEQVRRLLVARDRNPTVTVSAAPLERHVRANGLRDLEPVLDRLAARAQQQIIVTDMQRRVIAVSSTLRDAKIELDGAGRLTINRMRDGRMERLLLRVPPTPVRDAGGTQIASAFFLPGETAEEKAANREFAIVDRRLVTMLTIATLAALLLTFLLSRHITRPIERLTVAVHAIGRGELSSRVQVNGRDEIAQLATSFNTMADAIAMQQELRQRMAGDVAHELRTPLTNLRCELEAIQDGLASADPPRIASLHEEVLHLQRLVEDLQELAVADAGALPLHLERLDLNDVIARAAGTHAQLVLAEKPLLVDADPTRLRQIVQNLLSNAISHTPEGGAIEVRLTQDDRDARVSVRDSGPGLAPEQLERIFERFYRVDEARGRERGGAGLGLAIVRRLVELHGGRVWAESPAGEGATFTFTIPLARS